MTTNPAPGIARLRHRAGDVSLGGSRLTGFAIPIPMGLSVRCQARAPDVVLSYVRAGGRYNLQVLVIWGLQLRVIYACNCRCQSRTGMRGTLLGQKVGVAVSIRQTSTME
jgi:hypothetical protein